MPKIVRFGMVTTVLIESHCSRGKWLFSEEKRAVKKEYDKTLDEKKPEVFKPQVEFISLSVEETSGRLAEG